ncbi:MAG: HAMP domain-containing protein [bacterium]|nr:HAMP domain-containing protein [bacterium]
MENDNITHSRNARPETRSFLKGISAKLITAVLIAVIIPFFGLVYFIDTQIDTRLKENVVGQSLLSLAGDLASQVDEMIRNRNADLELMASGIVGDAAIDGIIFNRHIQLRQVYDLLLLIGSDGKLITLSTVKPDGSLLSDDHIKRLNDLDYSKETWYRQALTGAIAHVDQHKSPLTGPDFTANNRVESQYHIGFAVTVKRYLPMGKHPGVLYALVNWRHIQEIVDVPAIKAYFSGLVKDKEPSPYAWIWGADANTILAHKNRKLYGIKVDGPELEMPYMVEDARSGQSGHYREYSYRGKRKNASFHHCNGPKPRQLDSGFGWVVGVGIDNEDIYAMSSQLSRVLYLSTVAVIALVVIWTMLVARRTTKPILSLQKHMRNVSNGNLEEHIHIDTGDEVSDLAEDFNRMIQEIKEKRAQLIKMEKDAAWREMAQQISHDIKNTLTPIMLSIDLLKQSAKDRSPNYNHILQQTLEMIESQVGNLQEISSNFYEFTGGRLSELKECDLGLLMSEVVELNSAWANELNIQTQGVRELTDKDRDKLIVLADTMKFHRLLTNLVSNAFQAMPDGGTLEVVLQKEDNMAVLEIRDTGVGIPDDVREHLFEPYFTTRSKGTGLGLAIAKRVVEESNGTISLEPNESEGVGTVARIRLPLASTTPTVEINNKE